MNGLLRFAAFKRRLSPGAQATLAHVHAFLGKMTFFLGLQNCVVRARAGMVGV